MATDVNKMHVVLIGRFAQRLARVAPHHLHPPQWTHASVRQGLICGSPLHHGSIRKQLPYAKEHVKYAAPFTEYGLGFCLKRRPRLLPFPLSRISSLPSFSLVACFVACIL
jgi:hypothetical protein